MKGRPPVPTLLKIKRGTLEKSRTLENELTPRTTQSLQPRYLNNSHQLNEWEIITKYLAENGILTEMDISMIEAYCIEAAKYREAIERLNIEGLVLSGKMGDYVNPYHLIAERSLDRMVKIGVLFGISPAARTKVSSKKDNAPNKLKALIG